MINPNFQTIIAKNRPFTASTTIRNYMCCLKNISAHTAIDFNTPEDFITHYDDVMKYLLTMDPNNRKTKIASIVVLIDDKFHQHSDLLAETINNYRCEMFESKKAVEAQDRKQTKNDKELKNHITWDEVKKVYDSLKKQTDPLWEIDLNKQQFFLLQDFVLLSCYMLINPRRSKDYVEFRIRNVDKNIEAKQNYMEASKTRRKKSYFIFNTYKNSNHLGQQQVEIPITLKKIIQKWMEKNPFDFLLVNNKYQQITQSKLTMILNKIFKANIGSSALRHIFLTHNFHDVSLEELEKVTYNMGSRGVTRTLKYVKN